MRGLWHKFVCGVLAVSFVLSLFVTVLASSVDNPLCDFIIIVTDETEGEFTGEFYVTLTDIERSIGHNYTLTTQNFSDKIPIKDRVLANTTYEVGVPLSDFAEFALYDVNDDKLVGGLITTESVYVARWAVRRTSQVSAYEPEIPAFFGGIIDQLSDYFDVTDNTTLFEESADPRTGDYYDVATGKALFEKFYNTARYMVGNPAFNNVFWIYGSAYKDIHASRYAKYTSGTEAEWFSFSIFERFLWYETYLQVMTCYYIGDYDYFFGTENEYLGRVVNDTITELRNAGDGTEANAYRELMLWQYSYLQQNSTAYNFMTNISRFDKTSIQYKDGVETIFSDEREIGNELGGDSGGVSQVSAYPDGENETLRYEPVPETKQEGIWDKAIEGLKSSILTFIILLLFASAWIGVIVYRKLNDIKVVEEN